MPNLITHIYFAKEVEKHLPDEQKTIIEENKDAFLFGSIGPDYLFALRELGIEIGRYPNIMQYVKHFEVFNEVAKYLNASKDRLLISYTLGLMCHYVADLHCHPYVNAFCEEGVVKDLRPILAKTVHTLIESAGDEYVCTKRMGFENSNKYKPNKDLRTRKKTRLKVGKMYEDVINNIYGIPLSAKKASQSLEITRIFLAIANDPHGKLRPIVDKIEDKHASKKKFTALMRPPEGYGTVDYLNFNHKEWRVARNRDQKTDLDFIELIDSAIDTAAKIYIPMLAKAIFEGAPLDKQRFRVNYEGIDIEYIYEKNNGIESPSLPIYFRKETSNSIIADEENREFANKEEITEEPKIEAEIKNALS
ncbi:MAG: zinc dependent phospholipase C family protein [Bacilli bacterium]|nr:zinc dependent phospholipase C family protein [Bacilli bacterium]